MKDTVATNAEESDKSVIDLTTSLIKETDLDPRQTLGGVFDENLDDWDSFFLDIAAEILDSEMKSKNPNFENETLDEIWGKNK